jgi:hypothetical protein
MVVKITYKIQSGEVRTKVLVMDSAKKALNYFKFRYGHKVVSVDQ